MKKRARILIFHLNSICDMSCPYCLVPSLPHDKDELLSSYEKSQIINSLPALDLLILTGGEPFMDEDLISIVEMLVKRKDLKKVVVVTSGSHPEKIEDFAKKCLDTKLSVSITLDGFRDLHNSVKGKPSSFDKALRSLKLLKGHGIESGVSIMYSEQIIPGIDRFLSYVINDISPDFISLTVPRGPAAGINGYKDLDMDIYAESCRKIRKYNNLTRLQKNFALKYYADMVDRAKREYIREVVEKKGKALNCLAGRTVLVLYPDGRVSACESMHKPSVQIRNCDYVLSEAARRLVKQLPRRFSCFCSHECFVSPSLFLDPLRVVSLLLHSVKSS